MDLHIDDLTFDVDSEKFVLETNDSSTMSSSKIFELQKKSLL